MKVIFLDIDGVLNNRSTVERFHGVYGIDEALLELFKRITGVKIVLSSTWRMYPKHLKHVRSKLEIYDVTPQLCGPRSKEIKAWLSNHEVTDYVIIDDDIDASIEGHFFQTEWEYGLTEDIVNSVIEYFKDK